MSIEVSKPVLDTMRERGGRWYAYSNEAVDSASLGDMLFLQCGPGCTHVLPPVQLPDGKWGMGWKYRLAGEVNLKAGIVGERYATQ